MLKLIIFYSQGEPFDNALNLTVQKNLMIERYKNEVDLIIEYTPTILRSLGYDNYCNEYEEHGVIFSNKEQKNIGFSKWKPLICKIELLKSSDDDIIMYHDVDCIKYPIYLTYNDVKKTVNQLLQDCKYDFYFPQEHCVPLEKFCKNTVIVELGENSLFNKNFSQLCVNFFILKKSENTFKLLNEWIEGCNDRWINGISYLEETSAFIHHCPEQSILNNIIANWIRKNKNGMNKQYPFFFLVKRDINNIYPIKNYNYLKYLHL